MLETRRRTSRPAPEALLNERRDGSRPRSARGTRGRILSPETLAALGWRDLARLAGDARAHPGVRARAERLLTDRSGSLTPGERTTLARNASRALIPRLQRMGGARVIAALLGNPRLVEADVVAIATDARTPATSLSEIARCSLWNDRRAVKMALALNPASPAVDALRSLAGMHSQDLERIAQNPSASPLVRTGAARRLVSACDLP